MIRPYKNSDWNQVRTIYDLAKPDEMKGIAEADQITPLGQDGQMLRYFFESEIWVYEEDGEIFGYAGQKGEVISWLMVHPAHRRKGVGRQLMAYVLSTRDGLFRLNVTQLNQAAIALYEGLGFEVYEKFTGNMYGNPVPAQRMRLEKFT